MQMHDSLEELADHPELIGGAADLRTFAEHLKHCQSCRDRLKQSLRFHAKFIAPVRREWRHLSKRQVRSLRQGGFVPGATKSATQEEWHAEVCARCREAFTKQIEHFSEARSLRRRNTWLLCGIAVSVLFLLGVAVREVRRGQIRVDNVVRQKLQLPSVPGPLPQVAVLSRPENVAQRSARNQRLSGPLDSYRGTNSEKHRSRARSDGHITEISDRIKIDVGSQDGVKAGDSLVVYRGAGANATTVGTIKLTRVYPDRSYGLFTGRPAVATGDAVRLRPHN